MSEIYMLLLSIHDNIIFIAAYTTIGWMIHNRIVHSIKHEYDRKLEILKYEYSVQQKSAVFAEFLAEWTHVGSDTKRLNQLLWELTLYLPSHLVKEMQSMISNGEPRTTPNELLVKVRAHLMNNSDPILITDIAHFKHPQNSSMISSQKK